MDAPTDRTSPSSAQSPDVSDAPVSGSREPQGQASESLAPESAIFRLTLIEFREELSPAQVEEFSKATVSQVKRKVMEIQSKQEASKELMNLSRLRLFLEQFSNFDSLCKEAEVWGDDAARLSSWIWGPSSWILKTASEHPKTLESVLDAYCKLGKHVPATHHYRELVLSNSRVAESLAYMYHDLLSFQRRVARLLRWWKKTFESSWKDYDGEFRNLLANFKSHSELLAILFSTWQQQRANEHMGLSQDGHSSIETLTRRFNDFFLQFQDESQDSNRHAAQIRGIVQRGETMWKDIRQQMNDQTILAADSQQVLNLLVSMFEQLRKNMTWQFDKLEDARKADMKRRILKLISNQREPQAAHHESFRKMRTPGTGNWLLEDSVVWSWLHEPLPSACLVWLRGRMGAGKTVLTSLIIEECRQKDNFHTSYFYCVRDNNQQNTSLAVLMDILAQMAQHNNELIAYCNEKAHEGPLGQINVIKQLLEAFCEHETNQFVVIDGLDECEKGERKIIVEFWRSMVDKINVQKPGKLRVFFVSQDKPDIEAALKSSAQASRIYVHPAYTDKDIKIYVLQNAPEIQKRFKLDPDQNRFLENLICKRAEGMFLYAYLTIDNLVQQVNFGFYHSELEQNLPDGLADAYNRTIARLKKSLHRNSWLVSRKILIWLAGATRPLKETELAAALAIELDDRVTFNYEARKLCEDIRVMCGPLVRVVTCGEETRIEFTHSSTRSFLREHMEDEGLGQKNIEFDLATKCLWYLALPCFQPGLSGDALGRYARDGYYALQDYASAELRRHMQQLIQHTAPLFVPYSAKATENSRKLAIVLRRFLNLYRDIKPLSGDALSAGSTMSSRGTSPMTGFETPSSSWGESTGGPSSQEDSLFVASVTTARSSLSPFPPSLSPFPSSFRPAAPDPNGDPVAFCEPFRGFPELHAPLAQLWTHLYEHKRLVDPEERERVAILQLRAAVRASRAAVQGLGESAAAADREAARALYGQRLYKCERVPCDFFFEGFATAAERDEHARRHEKPYRCKVPDCSLARFGFSNKKDRDKHVRTYHTDKGDADGPAAAAAAAAAGGQPPDDGDDGDDDGDDGDPGSARRAVQHICSFCSKRFTRKANLDSHIDTHNGVRRHSCAACGKAFTRASDLRRHRKLHERRTRGR